MSYNTNNWLPTSKKEMLAKGWDEIDVILFSGDAYVDHPSFGSAIIARIIENEGLRIAIVPQPNWRDDLRDFKKFGKPKLFFAVTSGCMDSMVNHYTANKRLRSNDAYTPGGKAGFRPDYATIVYSNILKNLFPDVPVIIGGIEASLRRLTHYDYWSDKLKPGILIESKADLLVYGMGEKPMIEIISLLKKGLAFNKLQNIPQTAYIIDNKTKIPQDNNYENHYLYSHNDCRNNKIKFAKNFRIIEEESNKKVSKRLIQEVGNQKIIVNPPLPLMSEKEIDNIYNLPFTYLPHPRYRNKEPIPAYEMIKFSVNIHRGCFGGCSFCTISAHQGKFIISRSEKSIMNEVDKITKLPDFKGYISDIGGPSANMYNMKGKDTEICDKCKKTSCIFPYICKNLDTNHKILTELYKKIDKHHKIKKSFVGSGIRYDMLFNNKHEVSGNYYDYAKELITNHVSGRLKVAPEHNSEKVLKIMRKPSFDFFLKFKNLFDKINDKNNLNQQLIPYLISSHPGCDNIDMAKLVIQIKKLNLITEQVQDFTPTPMTLATVIYYSGIHPYTLDKINAAKTKQQKLNQKSFLFWYKKENFNIIKNILQKERRNDLIKLIFNK
ncbi:MAG: YgiQ family radical SAM protein [Bacteroidales bacterium]|nr:YgiQ family radical SAM protein [Bacteroidales bacterium]